ncbi:hypothetical protein JTB14_017980 [Gonioctena quinquepunctata]|nr:hypothetical protein JTB14_017980 [Gonioctena quinquepunctata]
MISFSDLKVSSDEEDVTSGSEYFPASYDEDPEESVSRQQIAYKRNIVKVKRKVFPEKTHNLQKDIQENTSIAKTNEEEIETSGAERKNVGTSSNRKEKSIVIHVTADGLNVKKRKIFQCQAKVSKKRTRNPEEWKQKKLLYQEAKVGNMYRKLERLWEKKL